MRGSGTFAKAGIHASVSPDEPGEAPCTAAAAVRVEIVGFEGAPGDPDDVDAQGFQL